ncbi:MAG: outer membrane lipoprotein chaperone LolA [Candidatus Competibacteraceae bacterium]|jgi:outer membrane lipoprotein carrier protein|nr:outer membrane lipoprotein chaperone LolA [Candidatus Competibacteraceae bacterium]
MRKWLCLTSSLLVLLCNSASAQEESLVQRYFQELRSLSAEFEQQVFDDQSRQLETSSGRMVMQKPGLFRWDYAQPSEQIIVSDGKRLWAYDVELEQITVRALDQALSATPLALLSGAAPIEDTFKVNSQEVRDGLEWFVLKPKQEQPEFNQLRIAFKDDQLHIIELEDVLNQRTQLTFTQLERNVVIDSTQFEFTPPPGVDVVGDVE